MDLGGAWHRRGTKRSLREEPRSMDGLGTSHQSRVERTQSGLMVFRLHPLRGFLSPAYSPRT